MTCGPLFVAAFAASGFAANTTSSSGYGHGLVTAATTLAGRAGDLATGAAVCAGLTVIAYAVWRSLGGFK